MRLAIISHCYPPYLARGGGVATYSHNLAKALGAAGIDTTVFCGGQTNKTDISVEDNVTVFRLPYKLIEVPPNFLWFQIDNRKILINELKKFNIIHSQSPENTIALLAKRKSPNIKWVITFHAFNIREVQSLFSEPISNWSPRDLLTYTFGTPISEILYRTEIKYSDHYIFTAKTNISDYIKYYNVQHSKYTFIPNGVDMNEILDMSKHTPTEDTSPVILFFGRLYARKGAHYLIKAMRYILKENNETKLKIIGSGPQEPMLRHLINRMDLQNNIFMENHMTRKQLLTELYNCVCVVFPSLYEVQCTSVLEAMACRKSVVAFKIPSMEEIIDHMRTGYLVDKQNIKKLGEGISLLLNNKKLRMYLENEAYEYILKEHDWSKLVKNYIDVYESL